MLYRAFSGVRARFRGFSLKTLQREALSVWIAMKSNMLNKVLSYKCEIFVQNEMETKYGRNVPKWRNFVAETCRLLGVRFFCVLPAVGGRKVASGSMHGPYLAISS